MKGYIFGLVSGFLWGVTGISYEHLNANYPITTTLTIILLLLFIVEFSSLILSGLSHYKMKTSAILKNENNYFKVLAVIVGVIGGPIGMFSYLQAITYIGVGYAAPISSAYPVFGAFLAFLFLKDHIGKLGALGGGLSISCTFFLSLDVESSQFSLFGIGLAVLCAVSWGSEIVLSSFIMNKLPSQVTYFFRQVGASTGYLILLQFFDVDYSSLFSSFGEASFSTTIIVIILSSMISYQMYYKAISMIKPIRAMMLNITYGFWVVILGFIWNGSTLKSINLFFVVGVLAGALMILKDKKEAVRAI